LVVVVAVSAFDRHAIISKKELQNDENFKDFHSICTFVSEQFRQLSVVEGMRSLLSENENKKVEDFMKMIEVISSVEISETR
jgi:histidyl-tRNA synthetase